MADSNNSSNIITTQTSSSPISSTPTSSTPQAGPLPTKRGEIGYSQDLHAAEEGRASRSESPVNLPARHPADRDHADDDSNDTAARPSTPDANGPTNSPTNDSSSTLNSTSKRRRLFKLFKPKKIPTYAGFRLTTLLAFLFQLSLIGATVAGWALTIKKVTASKGNTSAEQAGASSSIFVHVVFAIAVLGQFIFLERRVFMLRAQRYTYKHPGQFLPTSRYLGMGSNDPLISFSPWNRPPLPTYAAALAQSGVGTGDVEDHLIAAPPPPAYHNTRGSTLLLQGFLTDTQRAERPPSIRSQSSRRSGGGAAPSRPTSQRSQISVVLPRPPEPTSRPVSYRSTDSEWEQIQDAERAIHLEETLSSLQRPASRRT